MSRTRLFFCQQYQTTFRQLRNGRFSPNLAMTHESRMKHRIRTEIYEKFSFRGHLPPKPQTLRGSNRYKTTFWQLRNGRFSPNLTTTRKSRVKRRIRTEIYEKFLFRGHLPPKPQTLRGSNRYLTQSRLQVKGYTAERYCVYSTL